MSSRKVCVIVNSRANYARIKTVLRSIRAHSSLELQLIVGASALLHRFGSVVNVIREDGFVPDSVVHSIVEGRPQHNGQVDRVGHRGAGDALREPDAGHSADGGGPVRDDRDGNRGELHEYSVAHTQGGEVSGSIDENVRHAVTKLSHIHFPATTQARDFLIRMVSSPRRCI